MPQPHLLMQLNSTPSTHHPCSTNRPSHPSGRTTLTATRSGSASPPTLQPCSRMPQHSLCTPHLPHTAPRHSPPPSRAGPRARAWPRAWGPAGTAAARPPRPAQNAGCLHGQVWWTASEAGFKHAKEGTLAAWWPAPSRSIQHACSISRRTPPAASRCPCHTECKAKPSPTAPTKEGERAVCHLLVGRLRVWVERGTEAVDLRGGSAKGSFLARSNTHGASAGQCGIGSAEAVDLRLRTMGEGGQAGTHRREGGAVDPMLLAITHDGIGAQPAVEMQEEGAPGFCGGAGAHQIHSLNKSVHSLGEAGGCEGGVRECLTDWPLG